MAEIKVVFTEKEDKKHSVRFNCKDANPAVSSIYVSRVALQQLGNPDKIEVVIKAAE